MISDQQLSSKDDECLVNKSVAVFLTIIHTLTPLSAESGDDNTNSEQFRYGRLPL